MYSTKNIIPLARGMLSYYVTLHSVEVEPWQTLTSTADLSVTENIT
jgi:hypothetical protein